MKDLMTLTGRFNLLIVPHWLQAALKTANRNNYNNYLDIDKLLSILSLQDVQKYIEVNKCSDILLKDAKLDREFIATLANSVGNALMNNKRAQDIGKDVIYSNTLLYSYFNDSSVVCQINDTPTVQCYYTLEAIQDDVVVVKLHPAFEDKAVVDMKQADALRNAYIDLRRQLERKTLAKEGLIAAYLNKIATITVQTAA